MGLFSMMKDAWEEAKQDVLWDKNSKTCGSCRYFTGMTGSGTCLENNKRVKASDYYCDDYEYFGDK